MHHSCNRKGFWHNHKVFQSPNWCCHCIPSAANFGKTLNFWLVEARTRDYWQFYPKFWDWIWALYKQKLNQSITLKNVQCIRFAHAHTTRLDFNCKCPAMHNCSNGLVCNATLPNQDHLHHPPALCPLPSNNLVLSYRVLPFLLPNVTAASVFSITHCKICHHSSHFQYGPIFISIFCATFLNKEANLFFFLVDK